MLARWFRASSVVWVLGFPLSGLYVLFFFLPFVGCWIFFVGRFFVRFSADCSVFAFSYSEIGELRFWLSCGSFSLTRKGLVRLQ